MNSFLNNLLEQAKLQSEIWAKIKIDWTNPTVMEQQILLDDKKRLIAGKIDGVFTVIGYTHLEYIAQENDLIYLTFLSDLKKLTSELRSIITAENWKEWKEIIITTYQISTYPNFPLDELPLKAKSYLYMNEYPNLDSKYLKLRVDQEIIKYKKGKELLSYMLDRGKNLGNTIE